MSSSVLAPLQEARPPRAVPRELGDTHSDLTEAFGKTLKVIRHWGKAN